MGRMILLTIILVSVGALGVFLAWSNQPSEGTRPAAEREDVDVQGASTSLDSFASSMFATKVTSNLKLKTKTELRNTTIIGQYLLVDKNPYISDQLAVTIGTINETSVSEISPVQFRQSLPDEYKTLDLDVNYPQEAIMFEKRSGYEKSIFWIDGNRYVGIVVSGNTGRIPNLEQTLHSAVIHWSWL